MTYRIWKVPQRKRKQERELGRCREWLWFEGGPSGKASVGRQHLSRYLKMISPCPMALFSYKALPSLLSHFILKTPYGRKIVKTSESLSSWGLQELRHHEAQDLPRSHRYLEIQPRLETQDIASYQRFYLTKRNCASKHAWLRPAEAKQPAGHPSQLLGVLLGTTHGSCWPSATKAPFWWRLTTPFSVCEQVAL